MAHPSKQKGNRFEREIVDLCKIWETKCVRAWGSNGRALGQHEEVDCLIEDYFKPLMYSGKKVLGVRGGFTQAKFQNDIFCNMFKHLLNCDDELRRDAGTDFYRFEWYENHIRRQLMKLDDITLTFLINASILIEENIIVK